MQVYPITYGKKDSNIFFELCLSFDGNDARRKIAKHARKLGNNISNENEIIFEKKVMKNVQTNRNDVVRIATVGNMQYFMWNSRPGNISIN